MNVIHEFILASSRSQGHSKSKAYF